MKNYLIAVIALVIGLGVGYELHQSSNLVGSASPSGTQQSQAQLVEQTINTATIATTTGSFAIFNNSYDRIITDTFAACTGVAVENQTSLWQMSLGTSTVSTSTATNVALVTIATTSATVYVSSSTAVTSGTGAASGNQLWPASTWLVFAFNATDTAVCTAGVKFIAL